MSDPWEVTHTHTHTRIAAVLFAFPNPGVPRRDGSNYYRVERHMPKQIAASEWQNARPYLALFTRKAYSRYVSPRITSPRAMGFPCYASGSLSGKKRRRQENGNTGNFGGGGNSSSSSKERGSGGSAAAEVIEVDDGDSDRGDADTPPAGDGVGGARDDAGDRANGGGGTGSSSNATNSCRESPRPDAVALATASDGRRGANSTPATSRRENQEVDGECNPRDDDPGVLGPISSPAKALTLDPGASNSCKVSGGRRRPADRNTGSGNDNCSGSSNLESEMTPSPRRRRPRVHGNIGRENRGSHEDLTGEQEGGESGRIVQDDDEDVVQMITSNQDCGRRGGGDGRSFAASSLAPYSNTKATPAAHETVESGVSASWMSQGNPPDSPPARLGCSQRDNNGSNVADSGVYLDSAPLQPRNPLSSHLCERQVHDVDDDASSDSPSPPSPVTSKGKLHPSGVAMPFIGPARPPESKPKPLPPRPRPPDLHETSDDSSWLKPISIPASNMRTENRNTSGRRLGGRTTTAGAAAASRRSNRGGSGGGSGAAKDLDGQTTIISSWGASNSLSSENSSASGGGRGGGGSRSSSRSSSSKQEDEEWRPPRANGASYAGLGAGGGTSDCTGRSGGGRQWGLRSRSKKVTEDLTGGDESWEGKDVGNAYGGAGDAGRWASELMSSSSGSSISSGSRSMPNDATLTTIRGINLQQDHFDRIVDSDGWLTSQVREDGMCAVL